MNDASPTRSLVACVVFVDIVGYSKLTNNEQLSLKQAFNRMVSELTAQHPKDGIVRIDTGDGCAVAYLQNYLEATDFAIQLLESVQGSIPSFSVRVGVNVGPVRTMVDFNGTTNLVGDGINSAQRIMSFAPAQALAVSGTAYDILSQDDSRHATLMSESGQHGDKHGRQHRVYLYDWKSGARNISRHREATLGANHERNPEREPMRLVGTEAGQSLGKPSGGIPKAAILAGVVMAISVVAYLGLGQALRKNYASSPLPLGSREAIGDANSGTRSVRELEDEPHRQSSNSDASPADTRAAANSTSPASNTPAPIQAIEPNREPPEGMGKSNRLVTKPTTSSEMISRATDQSVARSAIGKRPSEVSTKESAGPHSTVVTTKRATPASSASRSARCAALLDQASLGVDPITPDDARFLANQCH